MALHAFLQLSSGPTNCSHLYNLPILLKTPTCYILDVSLISPPQYILPPPQPPPVTVVLFVALGW